MAPEGLAERGSELWEALTKGRALDASQAVLAAEACRVADRLEKLDRLLRGEVEEWARIREPRFEGDDAVLMISDAMSEARQQQSVLRQILTTLGVEKVKAGASKTGGGGVDEIAQRAARRRAAASGMQPSA